jgi:protein SCO1
LAVSACSAPISAPTSAPSAAETGDGPRIAHQSLFVYPWRWTNELGQPESFADYRGKPLVVTLVFTSCRSTCPRTIRSLRKLYTDLGGAQQSAQYLLVTLDPANDTPERLLAFKTEERLPEAWRLLRGTEAETRALADVLDVHVLDAGAHLVHDGRIVFFDERGMPTRSFGGWSVEQESPVL